MREATGPSAIVISTMAYCPTGPSGSCARSRMPRGVSRWTGSARAHDFARGIPATTSGAWRPLERLRAIGVPTSVCPHRLRHNPGEVPRVQELARKLAHRFVSSRSLLADLLRDQVSSAPGRARRRRRLSLAIRDRELASARPKSGAGLVQHGLIESVAGLKRRHALLRRSESHFYLDPHRGRLRATLAATGWGTSAPRPMRDRGPERRSCSLTCGSATTAG